MAQEEHPRRILHLDMDAFFASVEQADNPELRGKPVIVGGGKRGVVSACSYEARKYGIHSAMPSATARRLCPHGEYTPVRMHRYAEVSRQVMTVLERFSPLVQQASVDEAYLDVTGCEKLFGAPRVMGMRIKAEVKAVTSLNCSIGIAPVKFLAKIASDYDKPDGLFVLEQEDVAGFLRGLAVAEIPGVGKRTQGMLEKLGVATMGDVLRYPEGFWERRFGKGGMSLYERALGIDPREVVPFREPKSESAENTFSQDTFNREELKRWLMHQAERVGRSLRKHGYEGRTVTLKLKYGDFTQITRSRTLAAPTSETQAMFLTACKLLDDVELDKPVRLIGLGMSNFARGPRQISLFESLGEDEKKRQHKLDAALDEIRDKFGRDAVVRGRLLDFRKGKDR